jgi:hypothetical protein
VCVCQIPRDRQSPFSHHQRRATRRGVGKGKRKGKLRSAKKHPAAHRITTHSHTPACASAKKHPAAHRITTHSLHLAPAQRNIRRTPYHNALPLHLAQRSILALRRVLRREIRLYNRTQMIQLSLRRRKRARVREKKKKKKEKKGRTGRGDGQRERESSPRVRGAGWPDSADGTTTAS